MRTQGVSGGGVSRRVNRPRHRVARSRRCRAGASPQLLGRLTVDEANAWDWGTTVELELGQLPARDRYVVITVADDGRREQAGTWGATAARAARVRSASSIQRDDLRRVEVTVADGAVLFTFDFDA